MKILLVCLGNICRSPTAEAAVREALAAVGLDGDVEVASAGTGSWHLGDPPDPRMREAASAAGLHLDGTASQVSPGDFDRYDLLLAMDRSNAHELIAMAPDDAARAKVRLFREFDPEPDGEEVPDPYFGGAQGFEQVVEICRRTAEGLAAYAQSHLGQ